MTLTNRKTAVRTKAINVRRFLWLPSRERESTFADFLAAATKSRRYNKKQRFIDSLFISFSASISRRLNAACQ
jgi:hypothetical protein